MVIRKALPGDAAAIAKVHVDCWRATYAGIVPAAYLAGLQYDRSAKRWEAILAAGTPHVFVAELEAAGVVGFAAAGPELEGDRQYDADLSAIYVLPEHQGRGVGRALVAAAVTALREGKHRSLLLWVLRDNRARGFYERLGGRAVYAREQSIGGTRLPVVGYGWPSLEALAETLAPGACMDERPH